MKIIDFLFPKSCLTCGKSGSYICSSCIKKVGSPKPICCVCERPSVDFMTHSKCKKKLTLDAIVSVFRYEGVIRKAIIKLKYSFAKEIANDLAKCTIDKIVNNHLILPQKAILIPIPLFWYRENWRGFNQVEEVGKLLTGKLGWVFNTNILIRKSFRQPQTELKGDKRRENIRGVFSFNKNCTPIVSCHKSIVLFDDVLTTGSTMKEAGKVLKRNGFTNIWGLTISS
ncbi:hypothetical protein A2Z22_02770 [Candidatus Woesebacteria bacterium RBG_16_34_12]|uniref:Double zinc ribbon domain-containing protein n=1 Tax=Candidatus Woesebacteria bacterium RBG_16_34_12 TaxID=1802480 RepID=A0A1F7X8Z9_9BACT|nr:MAG: hypothetical protein A2Z22_02770 [Candidatus Woesebacteria bacterium RBG_16_34_12]